MRTLVWFRDDLRVEDNPALHRAVADGDEVFALYVLDESSDQTRPLGGASKWWLHHSLSALHDALKRLGVPLLLRRGEAEQVVPEVVHASDAKRVLWNRRYGTARTHDAAVKQRLRDAGIDAASLPGDVLFEPWRIATRQGDPYRLYSAFWRACLESPAPAAPLPAPDRARGAALDLETDRLASWGLLPTEPDWSTGLARRWSPGEIAGLECLDRFLGERVDRYASTRDFPAEDSGSELSPRLRWGELSPRTVWHRTLESGGDIGAFLGELGWREFAKHTAFHFGPLEHAGLNPRFDEFPWQPGSREALLAWKRGETGFSMVDAGMRELWQTGFMHNRVRMITASFLTKNLLVDWRVGEAWFWDTLVDADEASNPFNWQWVAGCGADAAPYFRIFNPELQQQKFDPHGHYVSLWAPENAGLPQLVDLKASRRRALDAYDTVRAGGDHF